MPEKKSTAGKVADGFSQLQKLVKDSDKVNQSSKTAKKPSGPPPVQTDSVLGLVSSLKDRAKYAFFGPDDKK